eukprot:gnl/TRDRNA2_/TRDRNA2_150019_c4_seq1.p1 gnl/TRDRNA2_/TRDRNA2_150019_c4~~gnl/TRDRNA2_/TRDRNA2_150019_c4_seq1.p1  ORF type:complete len:187 (-),score=18.43 gnl/TRDRNA2_/TRDRNA2_150019_c4_seq1:344-826(-)
MGAAVGSTSAGSPSTPVRATRHSGRASFASPAQQTAAAPAPNTTGRASFLRKRPSSPGAHVPSLPVTASQESSADTEQPVRRKRARTSKDAPASAAPAVPATPAVAKQGGSGLVAHLSKLRATPNQATPKGEVAHHKPTIKSGGLLAAAAEASRRTRGRV